MAKLSKEEYLKLVAQETSRMSQPGSFYGRVLKKKNEESKDKAYLPVHNYFLYNFPLQDIWECRTMTEQGFEKWHKLRLGEIAKVISDNYLFRTEYNPTILGAKLIDTFMHQFMKYPQCRSVYEWLHLPLDRTALNSIPKLKDICGIDGDLEELFDLSEKYKRCPYGLAPDDYMEIQKYLLIVKEIFGLTARVELNAILWAGETKGKKGKK